MRRHLGAILTMTALTLLGAGCLPSGSAADTTSTGVGGGGGAGGGTGPTGAGGSTGSLPKQSEASLSATLDQLFSCSDLMMPFAPVQLSLPDARAMASAAQVRGILLPGSTTAPPPSLVRSSEIFNYYHVDYPVMPTSEVTVVTELVATDLFGDYLLQIAVVAPTTASPRRPTSVTVLVDTSTSMEGESMSRANAALRALAASLNKGDVFTFLTTDSDFAPVRRRAMSDGDPGLFNAKEDKLDVRGAGSLGRGLERAYQEATSTDSYLGGGLNRLVVITDGGAPASSIDTAAIGEHWSKEQIQLVGVGVGSAVGYRNALLAAATNAGHGPSLYLDSADEAEPALHQRFNEVMDVAASDVSISVRLPWAFKAMSATTSNPAESAEQLALSDLGRGRSMVFRRPITLCNGVDISVVNELDIEVTATWRPATGENSLPSTVPFSIPVKEALLAHASPQILKASALLAFANALQALDGSRLQDACDKVLAARAATPPPPNGPAVGDAELESILAQLNAHPLMNGKPCQ